MVLIVFFLLLSSFEQFSKDWQEFDHNQIGDDGITVYEKRFAALKPVLPPNGAVGYVTDGEPYNIEFFLTQYSLAPLMVDPKESHEFVIGNFTNKASNPKTWNRADLDLRLDLGNGVKLFHSASR
ncbi:MAG TPA: hypothetical protein VGJ66_07970 [Pyrinomonadaceae bacterium]|jgi:hypothetical protein